jgi:hypothetical protein
MSIDPIIFPIGQFGGTTGAADDPATRCRIRLGDRLLMLDFDRFRTWAQAHGSIDRIRPVRLTRPALVDQLVEGGDERATAQEAVTELAALGLLAEVDSADARPFAAGHRLAPLMLGLGNSAVDPGMYELGLFDQPMIAIPRALCSLWEWSDRVPSLWAGCLWLAAVEEQPPQQTLRYIIEALHGLLAANAAYLDVVDGGTAAP